MKGGRRKRSKVVEVKRRSKGGKRRRTVKGRGGEMRKNGGKNQEEVKVLGDRKVS